jgi:hypothetical protein
MNVNQEYGRAGQTTGIYPCGTRFVPTWQSHAISKNSFI